MNNQRPRFEVIEGGNEPSSPHPISKEQIKKALGAVGSIAIIAVGVGLFTKDAAESMSTKAVCHGEQPYVADRGDFGYDVLGQIEGGIDNPRDATAAIRTLNPGFSIDSLQDGQVLTLPQVCESEDRNIMNNVIRSEG